MENDLSNYRKAYKKGALLKASVPKNPIDLFQRWFHEIESSASIDEVNAMTLATIGLDGYPRGRVVLLKKYTSEGFIFYTNYKSEKGRAILNNPNVCLSFFWHTAERQVIIKGCAEKIDKKLSDVYFESRPIGSQLGAIVSNQSEEITNRKELEDKLSSLEKAFDGQKLRRPEHWGGVIVKPIEFEFWQGRDNRLHDRIRYKLDQDDNWNITRLAP